MKYEILECGRYYHIYNRGNNFDNLFYSEENYQYFLKLYDKYLSPVFETYCYCLMHNHFHFLVKIKDENEIPEEVKLLMTSKKTSKVSKTFEVSDNLEVWRPISNFFNAYAKAINKKYNRRGSLFQYKFKRKEIRTEKYFYNLVHYIHANPEKHGIVEDFKTYKYSSYQAIIGNKPTKIKREGVINWYSDLKNFIYCHSREVDEESIKDIIIED
jgi:putative transposase